MKHETTRSRFCQVMDGAMPADRLPMMEWAYWWDKTADRWRAEGLPADADATAIKRRFGLDIDRQFWIPITMAAPGADDSVPIEVATDDDYEKVRKHLRLNVDDAQRQSRRQAAAEQAAGDCAVWMTLNGFFWWPRGLLGIERHLMAFYDQPELMHRMNEDLLAINLEAIDDLCKDVVPDFMTFAEDMSYNHGPMLSKANFETFLAPYYRRIIPELKSRGIRVLVDTDGDIERLIPWLESVGIEGSLPIEARAGNDIVRIRKNHPEFMMIGGYDKTVMHLGEQAMRAEFERLLPVMRSGRYIPSVDHQTPPDVSIDQYAMYVKLLEEYCRLAVA